MFHWDSGCILPPSDFDKEEGMLTMTLTGVDNSAEQLKRLGDRHQLTGLGECGKVGGDARARLSPLP